ncbi:PadR family transcriptional regulator [Clostridium guangxiense]|uniref:PadR family transcriptional regulator n=1 Tax=Clostridium guangxiense TaxID=1662055 RepID=UPI001E30F1D2|nr:PadR family transcriptional regulator [Clostridium guangxiense]MCD2346635.1 PadR family transcriptional regulator [Clostridium guangxiense]
MSQIDLIILGYLQHNEKSAYEMVKEFETWHLHYWLKISSPAIYKNIVKLYKKGYLDSRTVKEGEMPEKTIYSINEKGLSYFSELMEYSSNNIGHIYFDFNAFLTNIEKAPLEKRKELLLNFKKNINEAKTQMNFNYDKQLKITETPDHAFLLLDLYKDLYDLLEKWSSKVLKHYDV